MGDGLPFSTRMVLRDQGGADAEAVILAAIGDLLADGAWKHDRVRRRLVSKVDVLTPVRPPASPCEPLLAVDRLLHRAIGATSSGDVRELARWVARNAGAAPAAAVQQTVDWLVADGFLEEATATFELAAGVPEAWSGEHSIKELRPTQSGRMELRDMPRRRAREREGNADVESPNGIGASLGWAQPIVPLASQWSSGFAAGSHEHAVAHHYGGAGVAAGHSAAGHGHGHG